MATFSRSVTVDWSGPIMEGKGVAKAGTGAFNLPVSFPSRIGEPAGTTSPEELMAASHAACFAMALNATIGRKGGAAGRTLITATTAISIVRHGCRRAAVEKGSVATQAPSRSKNGACEASMATGCHSVSGCGAVSSPASAGVMVL